MACVQVREAVPIMRILFLMVLPAVAKGLGVTQPGRCRAVCADSGRNDCIALSQDRVDFQTAAHNCRAFRGELLEFRSKTDKSLFDIVSRELLGNYWIGLRLPAGACSDLSAPLRGYEWASGGKGSSFTPSWDTGAELCSPRCVSLSSDPKWTERPCSDVIDGFLCQTKLPNACQGQELSNPIVFQNFKGCSIGPCEHECKNVQGGYACYCFQQYIPDGNNPKRCKGHCGEQRCPAINEMGYESCPDGYLIVDTEDARFCEDIDECEMRSDINCECRNTFGSFACSCAEGFVLRDSGRCVKAKGRGGAVLTTPAAVAFVKPPTRNNTLKAPAAPAGRVLWLWAAAVAAVVVAVVAVRFYVVKRRRRRQREASDQQTPVNVPVDNTGC